MTDTHLHRHMMRKPFVAFYAYACSDENPIPWTQFVDESSTSLEVLRRVMSKTWKQGEEK